jgi:hypothetical protein
MPNPSIRIGGVSGWSIRATAIPSRGQFGKSHFSHVELWRDADAEQGTEAKLHVSVVLTDDAGCLDALTCAAIGQVTGLPKSDAFYLRQHVNQAWRRRARVMK